MELIPKTHQTQGVEDVLAEIAKGTRRIILTSPTGGGKSLMVAMLIRRLVGLGKRLQLFTNRRWLIDQTEQKLIEYGIDFGVRAAGHEFQPYYPVQLSSVQTEYQRVIRTEEWMLFDPDVVVIDEGHLANNDQYQDLVRLYLEAGATVVYVTATPLDMGGLADALVIAGTNSSLRECGLLVPALHYGAPEPDFRRFKIGVGDELTEPQVKRAVDVKKIYGHVIEWYDRTNPDRRPTILFAPGVEESRWLAQQLTEAGIPSAHVDGADVWVDDNFHPSSPSIRQTVLERSRTGDLKVICNRFVLREGVDMPWLGHGIFATTFGSITPYLQAGGRLLRNGGMPYVTIQDHGGNWWRWGSLNADRLWELELTSREMTAAREDRLRDKQEMEPARCSKCGQIIAGRRCPTCKFTVDEFRRSRPVMMEDGRVQEMTGDIFVQKVRRFERDTGKLWAACYYRGASTSWAIDAELQHRTRPMLAAKDRNRDLSEVSGQMLMKICAWEGGPDDLRQPYGPAEAAAYLRAEGNDVRQTVKGLTFAQVEALFFKDNGYWPPRNLGLMPAFAYDWYRRVPDVAWHRLNAGQKETA